jgi:hypothetical protein
VTTLKFAAAAAVSIACALAMAAPAHSADTPTTAQPAATPAAPKGQDPNQVICKRDGEIGSRLGGDKECHTRAQWEQVAHAKSGSAGTAH